MTVKELREKLAKFPDDKEVIISIDITFNGWPMAIVADSIKNTYENIWGDMVIEGVNNHA